MSKIRMSVLFFITYFAGITSHTMYIKEEPKLPATTEYQSPLQFGKNIPIQEQILLIKTLNAGCAFGAATGMRDKRNNRIDQNYNAEQDMQLIDFSSLDYHVPEENLPAFKLQFKQLMEACYKYYI